ncbi:MAG: hypothetical protein ACLFNU_10560 [Bacteroidales bacterium]
MKSPVDYKSLRTFSDIKIAKEKLRYSILLHEDMLSKSIDNLRGNFIQSLKQSAWRWGMKVAVGFLMNHLESRTSKRER